MHVTQVINNDLKKMCQGIHKKRMATLLSMVQACIEGKKLSVTGLGRALNNDVYEKHNIKRADRLVGNARLNQERLQLFSAMAKKIIGQHKQPVILVDWSDLSADGTYQLLRASLPVGGRALTLYDEVHTQKKGSWPRIEKQFLKTLSTLVPNGCRPIVITDAGFRTPWFNAVEELGWDFMGRVGGHTMMKPHNTSGWVRVERAYEQATTRPRYLGFIDLVKRNPTPCHAYTLKKKKLGRIKKTVFGQRCLMKHSEKNAQRERTPWLIVTSLTGGGTITKRVMKLYKTRMQIEESFRDVKNSRWGFCLDEARVSTVIRYENLLLIGSIATFAVWLIGKVAEIKQWQRQYQANTIKTRNVLSTFYLGCRVLKNHAMAFRQQDYQQAFIALREQCKAQGYA